MVEVQKRDEIFRRQILKSMHNYTYTHIQTHVYSLVVVVGLIYMVGWFTFPQSIYRFLYFLYFFLHHLNNRTKKKQNKKQTKYDINK